jgi:diguanylate cyclase (GGDEF)-like protein
MSSSPKLMSDQDELTGALNRNTFQKHLSQSIANALHSQAKLFLVCANIDNMKHFNAHNGHIKGNEILKRFVARVAPMLGKHQKLFRYAGDSFAIIGFDANAQEVAVLAQQICDDARANLSPPQPEICEYKDCLGPARISVSIGIVELEKGMTTGDFLQRAENQIFEAKSAGGDCIYINNRKHIQTSHGHYEAD